MGLRLLVTGGAGFIGEKICELSGRMGHEAISFDRRDCGNDYAETVIGDILDVDALKQAAGRADAILHCAAIVGPVAAEKDYANTVNVNVGGVTSVLEVATERAIPLVYLSTATLYGRRLDFKPIRESDPADPVSIYDATKLMAETLCNIYRKTRGTRVASVRTGFVYGSGHSTGEYFVPSVMGGASVEEPCGCDHPCDFTYVTDLARGMIQAAERMPLPEPIYNITGGRLETRGNFADMVREEIAGARITLGPGIDPRRHLRGACDVSLAHRDFGYAPEFDIKKGIADWVNSARSP